MTTKRTATLAAVATAIALLAPAAASASPAPGATASATGTARTSSGTTADANHVDASWQLASGEYACALVITSADAQATVPLDPGATGGSVDLPATGGTPIKVELQWVAPAVQPQRPSDACGAPRNVSSTTVTAAIYSPPPPPSPAETTPTAPTAPEPTTTDTSTAPAVTTATETTATPVDTTTLEARIKALEDAIAQLTDRVARVEKAVDAAWLAYEDAIKGGADAATAADIARGTALNAIYGLGAFASTAP